MPPPPGALRPFHFPPIERGRLSNGAPVLFARTGADVASLVVLLAAGAVREEPPRAGLASLTASLLESEAGGRNAAEVAEAIERLGMQLAVSTSWDSTTIAATGLRDRLAPAAGIIADLVRRPGFPEPEVERLRAEQIAGILQRRAEPRGLANEMVARYIFADESPFSRPLGGSPATVGALTRGDVETFHSTLYSPAAGGVVIAGDLDPEEAMRIADSALGDRGGTAPQPIRIAVDPRYDTARVLIVDRPGAVQSELRIGHVGVARDTPDYFPILVMNAVLGGAFSSRLNMNLRERHGFTYGVSSSFVMRRNPGPFLISTAVQTEVTAAAVREALDEVRDIRDRPVSARELDGARNYLAGIFPLRLQTTDGVASRLAELLLYDLPLDYYDDYRDRILAVDAEQVLGVARSHIAPETFVVVVVGDATSVRGPLEELAIGPVDVVRAPGAP